VGWAQLRGGHSRVELGSDLRENERDVVLVWSSVRCTRTAKAMHWFGPSQTQLLLTLLYFHPNLWQTTFTEICGDKIWPKLLTAGATFGLHQIGQSQRNYSNLEKFEPTLHFLCNWILIMFLTRVWQIVPKHGDLDQDLGSGLVAIFLGSWLALLQVAKMKQPRWANQPEIPVQLSVMYSFRTSDSCSRWLWKSLYDLAYLGRSC
jgi:hypothetical protein